MPAVSKYGERQAKLVRLPVDLADWLKTTGNGDAGGHGIGENDLVIRGLYLLREMMGGPVTPVSEELLADAIVRMEGP